MFCHQWQLGSYTSDLRQHIISVLYFYQAGLGGKQRPSGVTYSTHIDYQRRTSLPLCAVILSYIHKHCQTISCPSHGRWMFKSDPARWGINSYVELIPKKPYWYCHLPVPPEELVLYLKIIPVSLIDQIQCWSDRHLLLIDRPHQKQRTEHDLWLIHVYIHVLCFNSRDPDTFPSSF